RRREADVLTGGALARAVVRDDRPVERDVPVRRDSAPGRAEAGDAHRGAFARGAARAEDIRGDVAEADDRLAGIARPEAEPRAIAAAPADAARRRRGRAGAGRRASAVAALAGRV